MQDLQQRLLVEEVPKAVDGIAEQDWLQALHVNNPFKVPIYCSCCGSVSVNLSITCACRDSRCGTPHLPGVSVVA